MGSCKALLLQAELVRTSSGVVDATSTRFRAGMRNKPAYPAYLTQAVLENGGSLGITMFTAYGISLTSRSHTLLRVSRPWISGRFKSSVKLIAPAPPLSKLRKSHQFLQ